MMSCPYSWETSPPVSGVGAGHPGSWQGGTCNLPWSLLRSTLAGSRSGHWSHWCWCHWSLHVVTGGVGWSAVGAGLGCWHQPAAALPPASPETQPGRLLRAGGGTPWHSGQHTTGCNTRHHTTPPHSCLAPGSRLTSPSIAHYRGAAECPAPWQCGHTGWGRAESAAAVSRIAAVQPSSGVL